MKVADAVGDAIVVGIDGTSPGIDVTTFVAALWCGCGVVGVGQEIEGNKQLDDDNDDNTDKVIYLTCVYCRLT